MHPSIPPAQKPNPVLLLLETAGVWQTRTSASLQKLRASKGLAGPLIHGFFFVLLCFVLFVFFSVDKQTALRICGFHIRRCGGPAMGLEHAQILVSPACPGTSPWRHQGVNLLVRLLLLSTGCWIWRAEPGDSPQTFLQGLRS